MKVIPVIDILDGVVVRAVKGERERYRRLESKVYPSANPLEVASAFHNSGFGELYVADLNAIMGSGDNFEIIGRISKKTGLKVMVDAGVADIEKTRVVMRLGASTLVVGTETMTNIYFIEKVVRLLGVNRVIVSLDLRQGQLLAKFSPDKLLDPIDTLRTFQDLGIKRVIVLDLARVGSNEGVDVAFLRKVVMNVNIEVFVGGGVRSMEDLHKLDGIGISGVLLATSLHSGKVTPEQLVAEGFRLE